MLPSGHLVRLDVGGLQNMGLLPTRTCRGELAQRRGSRLVEDTCAPLAEAQSAGLCHRRNLVHRLLRLYVPPCRVVLIEEICLLAKVFVVLCQEEGLLCDGLSGECLCHVFKTESRGLHFGV